MIRIALLLAALAGSARADALIKPPPGWAADVEAATTLATKANEVTHFGGARALATSEVYAAPKPGVMLFVSAVAAKVSDGREAAARVEVDELHATSQRAALAGSGIVEEGWQERVDTAAKQIEATLTWRDPTGGTTTHARLVIAADPENLVAVTGECLAGDGADAATVAACKAALATLDPGIAPGKRVALALAPTGTRPAGDGPVRAPAQLSDGSRMPMAPITVPQEQRSTDRRPVYVGIGLVVMAAVLWWTKRRREKETPNE